MNRQRASTKIDNVKVSFGWQAMLSDVSLEIDKAKQRVADLEESREILQKKIKSGEVFPESLRAAASTHI